jgi:hypothetical protein
MLIIYTTCTGKRKYINRILMRKPEERRPLGRPIIDGKIILKWVLEKWDENMDWIDLAQDRDRWRAVENAVMTLQYP